MRCGEINCAGGSSLSFAHPEIRPSQLVDSQQHVNPKVTAAHCWACLCLLCFSEQATGKATIPAGDLQTPVQSHALNTSNTSWQLLRAKQLGFTSVVRSNAPELPTCRLHFSAPSLDSAITCLLLPFACRCLQDKAVIEAAICTGDEHCEWAFTLKARGGQGLVYTNSIRGVAWKLSPAQDVSDVSYTSPDLQGVRKPV